MLKLKNNVDLKQLEKHLQKLSIMVNNKIYIDCETNEHCSNVYCFVSKCDTKYINNGCVPGGVVQFYINKNRDICYCNYPEERNEDDICDKLYDLIKADLVEKSI